MTSPATLPASAPSAEPRSDRPPRRNVAPTLLFEFTRPVCYAARVDAAEHRAARPVRRWRMRRALMWTGIFSCVLIVLAAGLLTRWFAIALRFSATAQWVIALQPVSVVVAHESVAVADFGDLLMAPVSACLPREGGLILSEPHEDWAAVRNDWVAAERWPSKYVGTGMTAVTLPLWIPLALLAVPTAWLWLLDRRRPAPGKCRCGYDLTGNTSGRCPECGTPNRPITR